tara:strand:+ start:3868 stop:4989 length:1122 start_codon:yes stop_codon:yes gene_type:complete
MRSLDRLAETATSARVLNLHEISIRNDDNPAHAAAPMFSCRRLNEAILLKHALRAQDRPYVQTSRATATKIVFPISKADLKLGGYNLFIEQADFELALRQAVGANTPREAVSEDIELLREIARLPSLDPYLLRDVTQTLGRKVADCYFNISIRDIRAVHGFLHRDMRTLVERANGDAGLDTNLTAERLSHLMMEDASNPALAPLRKALRFGAEDFERSLKGWKGVLYYKWCYARLLHGFPAVATRMASLRLSRASQEDKVYLYGLVRRILQRLDENFASVKGHLIGYEAAFKSLIDENDPLPFQAFLRTASQSFAEIGRAIGEISHVCDFWNYRQGKATEERIDVEDARELIGELAHALGLSYDKPSNGMGSA